LEFVAFHKRRDLILKRPHKIMEAATSLPGWQLCCSNICLDFHGDPLMEKLAVFPGAITIWPLRRHCGFFIRSIRISSLKKSEDKNLLILDFTDPQDLNFSGSGTHTRSPNSSTQFTDTLVSLGSQ